MVKTFTGRITDAQKTHLFGVALGLKQTFPRYPMVRWLKDSKHRAYRPLNTSSSNRYSVGRSIAIAGERMATAVSTLPAPPAAHLSHFGAVDAI